MRENPRRNIWTAVLYGLLLTCLMTGCGGQPSVTEITLIHGWGSVEPDHEAMRRIYQDFEKENPDIRLHLISMPTTQTLIQKVEDSVMVGEIPDLVFLAGGGQDALYQYMADYKCLLDLMPYVEADAQFRANLAPANLDYWTTAENQLFTISDVLLVSGGYWYNQEIFEQAGILEIPKTWEEFFAACDKIQTWAEQGAHKVKALQPSNEGYLYLMDHILAQKGMDGTQKNHVEMEAGKLLDTLTILEQIHRFSISEDGAYNYRDEMELFNREKLAICVNGVWGASMISKRLQAEYALFPSEPLSVACESAGIGYVVGHTGNKEREQACVRFLKYMVSPKVQERILLETQQFPANPNIHMEDFAVQLPRFYKAVSTAQSADMKIEIPEQLWGNRQIEILKNNIIPVLSGEISKQAFLDLWTVPE